MSFAAKIVKQTALIYDVRSSKNHKHLWFIVEINKIKHEAFQRALKGVQLFNVSDFGKILYSGTGEPPEKLKNSLNEKYGMYET